MVMRLERGADLHMAQLMPLPLTVSCFSKIQIGFTLLVLAHPGSPGKRGACVCVCVCACVRACVRARVRVCVTYLSADICRARGGEETRRCGLRRVTVDTCVVRRLQLRAAAAGWWL